MGDVEYTVRICYDVKGWAYYRRAVALQKYAPASFNVTIGPNYGEAFRCLSHDLVLQLCYSYAKDIRLHVAEHGYDMVIVASYNVGQGHTDEWFWQCRQWCDHVIINSRRCWEALGRPTRTTAISNGVDREVFRLRVPVELRRPRVLWTGSQFHRRVKGYDEILLPLAARLANAGIDVDFRLVDSHGTDRLNTDQMVDWYNSGTIYIVASENEGTPNPALEAASAGCVIVATPVGNMPELITSGVNGELVERDVDAMFNAIMRCQSNYVEMARAMQVAIEQWHWRRRARRYFNLFRRLIMRRRERPVP